MMPKWTEQVRVKIENGIQGPLEDGYSWRKYGQKDILSAKYPRSTFDSVTTNYYMSKIIIILTNVYVTYRN